MKSARFFMMTRCTLTEPDQVKRVFVPTDQVRREFMAFRAIGDSTAIHPWAGLFLPRKTPWRR